MRKTVEQTEGPADTVDLDRIGLDWDDAHAVPPVMQDGGAPTKWELRKIRTRRLILRAGREMFAHQGFETPRVEDIARAAGVSRAAFYHHFKSIGELVQAAANREIRWQLRRYRSLDAEILQNPRRIRGWLERFFASFRSEKEYVLIIFRSYSMDPANVRLVFEEQERLIRSLARRIPQLGLLDESGQLIEDRVIRLASMLRRIETLSLWSAFDVSPERLPRALDLLSQDFADFVAAAGKG